MDNVFGIHAKISTSSSIIELSFCFPLFESLSSSWESLFTKSTNHLSDIELDCCYRFVDLCKEALFVVYQYSIDEKLYKQKYQDQRLTVTAKS